MSRASKICSVQDCSNLQPCPTPGHTKEAWAGSTRRRRLPGDWDSRRRTVLARDPICKVCDNALSVEVDHINDPDDHSLDNLQGICSSCHQAKTQREAAAARRAGRG